MIAHKNLIQLGFIWLTMTVGVIFAEPIPAGILPMPVCQSD